MTASLQYRSQFTLAPLQRRELASARDLCLADEVAHVMPLMQVEAAVASGSVATGLWGVHRRSRWSRELAGLVWVGANLTSVLPDDDPQEADDIRADVAAALVARVARPAAMVGPAQVTLDLWGRVESRWGPAREVRPRQASMVMDRDPASSADALPEGIESLQVEPLQVESLQVEPLRRATMDDYPLLLPAAVHMFRGEVGYDPMKHGRAAYEQRLQQLVHSGRALVQMGWVEGRRDVVFKADVGVVGGRVAQIQGVWVNPALRGRGLGVAGMAQLVRLVRADVAPVVSLYVNDFNEPALRAYRTVGFREVGTFATVMF